ncbi:MAG TPA: aspartate dehydrogenase domain-containing protein [Rhodocyclaceae bacterium]|nr:aspartate dehydrogenase domain-containing protein [Rhodocyclaceae bacterium]
MQKSRLAIVGCGFLGNIVADAWRKGVLADYELVGCLDRNAEAAAALAEKNGCKACSTLSDLLALAPDYVIEVASPVVLKEIAEPVLKAGASLVVLSIGAFADAAFLSQTEDLARQTGRRVHLASGAIGGFDVLRTTALMSTIEASITTEKGPASLKGTPIFTEALLTASERSEVFAGSAKDAIALFPTKVNVAVAAALATAGVDATRVSVNSVPGFIGDDHRIEVRGEEVHAIVDIYSRTSAIAGWSIVALLRNLAAPIMFG